MGIRDPSTSVKYGSPSVAPHGTRASNLRSRISLRLWGYSARNASWSRTVFHWPRSAADKLAGQQMAMSVSVPEKSGGVWGVSGGWDGVEIVADHLP